VPPSGPALVDPEIAALMALVEPARLMSDLRALVGFGTRHVLSVGDVEDRGIGGARDWLAQRFEAINAPGRGQVQVTLEPFETTVDGSRLDLANVVATLTGIGRPKRLVYVTAHYDSRTEDADDGGSAAPGANDNASGTAALLEIARVMSTRQWDAGIRLIAHAGTEVGLRGSEFHAPQAGEIGLPLVAVVNNASIGVSDGPSAADAGHVRVLAEGRETGGSRRLARYIAILARHYGPLEAIPAADASGELGDGDDKPFEDAGFPAARLTGAVDATAWQHSVSDTADRIDAAYLAAVVRLNVAVAATLALAPMPVAEAPEVTRSPAGTVVTWQPPAQAVAGYWVAIRGDDQDAYELSWSAEPTMTLPAGERRWVAVATSDDRGHMSLFSPEVEVR
jgi:hypothetical protein